MATVLAISSHVARGCVGLAATVPALQRLGHEVWALPTVLLASRPGLGTLVRTEVPPADLGTMLGALDADGAWATLGGVLTGYFPSAASVKAAAAAVRRIRQALPHVPVLVDPIVGDNGRLYVAEATAAAIRDELLPLATLATPNLFELQWLAGAGAGADAAATARCLGPEAVVVTSATETPDAISTLLIAGERLMERPLPRRAGIPNGAGDLLAGLMLGYLLDGRGLEAALEASLTGLDGVLAASAGHDALQLSALGRHSATGEIAL
jgi:pyridoxine kinase